MTDNEKTQDAPVMDGASDADVEQKKNGAREQKAADAAVHGDDTATQQDLDDDVRSIRGYGEDR